MGQPRCQSRAGSTRSEPSVYQLLPQPLRQLHPVAKVPTVSARAANDSLSVCFRMAACRAAKLLPEPQRGNVLAEVAGGPKHFVSKLLALDGCSNQGDFPRG